MEKRLTIAFWAALLGLAVLQSPGLWGSKDDQRAAVPVVKAPAPVAENFGPRRDEYKLRDPSLPYKIDLRNRKQVAEFFPAAEEMRGKETLAINAPGNAGPFDADGKLIMPLDPRNLH